MDLERVMVRLLADASQYTRVMNEVEGRLVAMSRRLSTFGMVLQAPIVAATGAAVGFGIAAGFASINAMKLAMAYDANRVSFEVMTGSAERGKKVLDEIVQLGIETPFKSPELLNYGKALMAIGVQAENVTPTLKVLADVSSAVGVENMPNIVLAYSQVKTAGRLMGQELRQFFNANVPLIEFLAKVRNVPESAIKGMVERAEINFSDVQRALNLMTSSEGGRFGGMNARRMQTVEGRWSAFVETLQVTLREAGLSFFEAFGIAEWLDDLTNRMNGDVRSRFDTFFQNLREGVRNVGKFFSMISDWADRIVNGVRDWTKENQELVKIVGQVLLGILAVKVAIAAINVLSAATALIWGGILTSVAALPVIAAGTLLAIIATSENFGKELERTFDRANSVFADLGKGLSEAWAGEDWKAIGQLIGLGLKVGLLSVWWGLIDEMESALSRVGTRLGKELEIQWAGTKKNWYDFRDELDPTVNKAQADINKAVRQQKYDDEVKAIINRNDAHHQWVLKNQVETTNRNLAPYEKQIQEIRERVAAGRIIKDQAKIDAADPFGAGIRQFEQDLGKQMYERMENDLKVRLRIWGPRAGWRPQMEKEWAQLEQDTENFFYGQMVGHSQMALFQKMFTGKGTARNSIPVEPQVSSRSAQLAELIKKEMTEGKWAGAAVDKFELYQTRMKLIDEAFRGPYFDPNQGGFGKMATNLMRPGSLLNEKERDFGRFEEFQNLKKAVGTVEITMPKAAMIGSQEATDAINRAQVDTQSVQEEIRNTLEAARVIQTQQRDYMKQVVDELKRLNGEDVNDQWGGGGDF